MKRSISILTLALAAIVFAECKKSSSNDVAAANKPGMSYELKATNANYGLAKTTAMANIVWTSGFAYPDVVKFEAIQGNLQVDFKSTHTGQIDLMAPVAVTFGDFTLPPGIYDKISLKIDLDRDGTNPVLDLAGTLITDSISIPIELQVTQSVELQTTENNVAISGDSSYLAVTTIDLSTVTDGITASMLLNAQLTSGSIIISQNSNKMLYKVVLDNLRSVHHHCFFERHHH